MVFPQTCKKIVKKGVLLPLIVTDSYTYLLSTFLPPFLYPHLPYKYYVMEIPTSTSTIVL